MRISRAFELIRRKFQAVRTRRYQQAAFRRALCIEGLETRRAMAFSIASVGTSITLNGSSGDDAVTISVSGSDHFQHDLPLGGNLVSNIDTDSTLPGEQAILASSVSGLAIYGNDGNDTIDASAWTNSLVVYGGAGNDLILGGVGNDELRGEGGDDTVEGNGGNDTLYGDGFFDNVSDGNDILYGGDGDDTLYGDDRVYGGTGNDQLYGGAGNDYLGGYGGANIYSGGDGVDSAMNEGHISVVLTDTTFIADGILSSNHSIESFTVLGSEGNDTIDATAFTLGTIVAKGLAGNDIILGGSQNDELYGGNGDDTIEGNGGNDTLYGDGFFDNVSDGNDILRGGDGDDTLYCDDRVYGGTGNDQLYGGAGIDTAYDHFTGVIIVSDTLYQSNSVSTQNHQLEGINITGSPENDTIDATAFTLGTIVAKGLAGNDIILGGSQNDELYGGNGDDTVEGNGGNDTLYGDGFFDSLSDGNDILRGGDGNDTLYGDDRVYGGTGNDQLYSGTGNDYLRGFSGNDILFVSNETFTDVVADDGYDKLFFDQNGLSLNLVSLSSISGIEEINLVGSGNNTLTLDLNSVLNLSDTSDTLLVRGEFGDTVDKGGGWSANGTEVIDGATYKVFTQGTAILKVPYLAEMHLSSDSIPENAGVAFPVGTLNSIEVDAGNTYSYSFTDTGDYPDNNAFAFDGSTLKTVVDFDFESKSSYTVKIRSTDEYGFFFDNIFAISVTNQNEAPTGIQLAPNTIAENAGNDALVGYFTSSDPDDEDTFTYELFDFTNYPDNAAFTISGNALRAINSFDFETKPSYNVRVRTTDAGGLSFDMTLTVSVTDVQEDVVIIGSGSNDTIIANYTGDGVTHSWQVTIGGVQVFNGPIGSSYALVIQAAGGNSDRLTINGSASNNTFEMSAGQVLVNSAPVRFTDVEVLSVVGKNNDDNFVITSSIGTGSVNITGGIGKDTLEVLSGTNTWNINGVGTGNVTGLVTLFATIETLRGGSDDDQFLFANAGSVTGQVHGGLGTDTLSFAAKTTSVTVNLARNTSTNTRGISGFETFIGGASAAIDTLIGPNSETLWSISGANSGSMTDVATNATRTFSNFNSITGGTAIDTFQFGAAGTLSNILNGGSGAVTDRINLAAKSIPLDFQLNSSNTSLPTVIGAYLGIERVEGNGVANTKLTQMNTAATIWSVNANNQVVVRNVTYTDVPEIVGHATGTDTINGPALSTTWSIDAANAGTLTNSVGTIKFSNIDNLTGSTSIDAFVFSATGSLTGVLNAGAGGGVVDTLNVSAKSSALQFQLNSANTSLPSVIGSFTGVEQITANNAVGTKLTRMNNTNTSWSVNNSGQVVVNNITYTGIPEIVGGPGMDTLTGPSLAGIAITTWALHGSDSGTLATSSFSILYSSMNNLTGGTGNDHFDIDPVGILSGNLNGGTGTGVNSVSYAGWATGVTVNLSSIVAGNATSISGLLNNIQMVIGSAAADTLTAQTSKGSVLVGLAGNDTLNGGTRNDLLIGGTGIDTIFGNSGDDILISGSTTYDTTPISLARLNLEWNSTRSYADRVRNLRLIAPAPTRLNGPDYFNGVVDGIVDTVFADTDADSLTGGSGLDWFYGSAVEILDLGIGGVEDVN